MICNNNLATAGGKKTAELRETNSQIRFLMAALLAIHLVLSTSLVSVSATPINRSILIKRISAQSPDIESQEMNLGDIAGDVDIPLNNIWNDLLNRQRRDTRTSRKIDSSSVPIMSMMPGYYPLVMAEMMPGSVKTRHPSIVAINGCPAYYIADHKGICRQVFQYTVNFGHPFRFSTAAYIPPTPIRSSRPLPRPVRLHPTPPTTTTAPVTKASAPKQSISDLLRSAAKKFDLSFLKKNSSNNSGEQLDSSKLDKLREQILAALKIPSNNSRKSHTTTPDYDD